MQITDIANKRARYNALLIAASTLNPDGVQVVGLDETGAAWYIMARISNHVMKSMLSKITLQVPDSVWRAYTPQVDEWTITESGQEFDVAVGGNVEALPTLELRIDDAKTGGFAQRQWVRIYNPNAGAVTNELVEITDGGLDTAALVDDEKMLENGDDIRIYDGGQEIDRFLVDMNTDHTKIFAGPFDFAAPIEMPIKTAILGTGAVTTIRIKKSAANDALLARLPNERGLVEIGSERFLYISRNLKARTIQVAKRAVRHSSAAAHSAGATLKWIEHDVWMYYANSELDAPETDPNHAAAYVLDDSDNETRVYEDGFGDVAAVRPGSWKTSVLRNVGHESAIYTGAEGDETADPREVLGMAIKSYIKSGTPAIGSAILECKLSHAGGIASVQVVEGQKRRIGSKWPKFMGLQKSKDSRIYRNQFNEARPSSTAYTAVTHTSTQTLGSGYKHVRFLASGSTAKAEDAEADLEISAVTVVITNPITAQLMGEEDNYDLDSEIQNLTTGQSLFLKWTMGIGDVLTIDTEARTSIFNDGTNANRGKRLDAPRLEWLPSRPGVVNRYKYIEEGVQGVTLFIITPTKRTR